jgi:hypothetical protein
MGFGIKHLSKRWAHAVIPYVLDDVQFPPSTAARSGIENTLSYYHAQAGVQLLRRQGQDDYLEFVRVSDRSASKVGRQGGKQEVSVAINDVGFVGGNKTTFADTSEEEPSLAFDGVNVLMAWRGEGNGRVNVATISGTPPAITSRRTLRRTSDSTPSIAIFNGQVWIALASAGYLLLLRTRGYTPGGPLVPFFRHFPIAANGFTPEVGARPAMVVHDSVLHLAWRGNHDIGNGVRDARITVGFLQGRTLVQFPLTNEASESGPSLASFNGNLYLAWRGLDDRLNVSVAPAGQDIFGAKFTTDLKTDAAPALAVLNSQLYIAWKEEGEEIMYFGQVQIVPGNPIAPLHSIWQHGILRKDSSDAAPALAWQPPGTAWLAWKGSNNTNLNLMPGSVTTENALIHELGHALGLLHEQQRPDRGSFVTIGPQRDDEYNNNYAVDNDGALLGVYDLTSIMHYSVDPATPPRLANLPPNPPIAPSTGVLSAGDVAALRYMYPIHHVVELPETTEAAPALSQDDGALYLAWRGSGNESLNSAVVTLDKENFLALRIAGTTQPPVARTVVAGITAKITHAETSDMSPSMGGVFLVWKGSDNEDLNMALALPSNPLTGKVRLGEQTDRAPAASRMGNYVAVAWKGNGNESLNIALVDADGSLVTKHTTTETTETDPSLTVHQEQLYVAWKGAGNNAINVARVDVDFRPNPVIRGLAGKSTLPVGCDEDTGPAIVSVRDKLVVAWKGESNDYIHFMVSLDGGASFINLHASAEKTSHAPALAYVERGDSAEDQCLVIAWKGVDNDTISLGVVNLVGLR